MKTQEQILAIHERLVRIRDASIAAAQPGALKSLPMMDMLRVIARLQVISEDVSPFYKLTKYLCTDEQEYAAGTKEGCVTMDQYLEQIEKVTDGITELIAKYAPAHDDRAIEGESLYSSKQG